MQQDDSSEPAEGILNARYLLLSFIATGLIVIAFIGYFMPDLLKSIDEGLALIARDYWHIFATVGVVIGVVNFLLEERS